MFKTYDENKGHLVWRLWVILMVELLGTFAMVFEIIAPNALHLGQNDVYAAIFGTFIMKAVWVTAFIWILIQICGKVSVNLNPAVTLGEVASGAFGWTRGISMIAAQVVGALCAAELAYQLSLVVYPENMTSLDAVHPVFQVPGWMSGDGFNKVGELFNVNDEVAGVSKWNGSLSAWATALSIAVAYVMEALLTLLLLASVFFWKRDNEGHGGVTQYRAFMIFALVTVAVYIGIFTENIALNPARLLAPAIIGQIHHQDEFIEVNFQFAWIYLAGELTAVMIFAKIVEIKKAKAGITPEGFNTEVRTLSSEVLVTRARYEWIYVGNKAIKDMNKDELVYALEFCKVDFNAKANKDDLEYELIEWIIFGLEEDKLPPLVTKAKPVAKAKPAPKKPAPKKPAPKKAEPKISKEEQAKRDAEREKLKAKVAKQTAGKKISKADLAKMKLTDLYGIGVKREEYFHANGITDMVKLSNKNVDTLTKKFIEGLPALKSWDYDKKKEAIAANIAEADFMVNELTK